MRRSFPRLATALVLLGTACSPSVNQAYKASIDQRVGALHSGGQRYEAPSSPEPMPIAVGQWSRYKLVDKDGHPGFITYNVVGQEGNAWWIEMLNESYTSRLVTLMLVDLGDRKDPATVEVKQFKQKTDDDAVNELPAPVLGLMKSIWGPLTESLVLNWQGKPQEAVEVPAGTFDASYKVQGSVTFIGKTWTSVGWSHPAVPITGGVKSRGVDNPSQMDLIEFGTSGAKSELM
jgi:hypothetical protein